MYKLLEVWFQPSDSVTADVYNISLLIFLPFYLLWLKSCFLSLPRKEENEYGRGTASTYGIKIFLFALCDVSSPLEIEEHFKRKIKGLTTRECAISMWTWVRILNSEDRQPESLKGKKTSSFQFHLLLFDFFFY